MTKSIAQKFGAKTYRIARNGNYAMNPLRNCPMLTLARAESYATDMRLAGFDVVVINMGGN